MPQALPVGSEQCSACFLNGSSSLQLINGHRQKGSGDMRTPSREATSYANLPPSRLYYIALKCHVVRFVLHAMTCRAGLSTSSQGLKRDPQLFHGRIDILEIESRYCPTCMFLRVHHSFVISKVRPTMHRDRCRCRCSWNRNWRRRMHRWGHWLTWNRRLRRWER